MPAPDQPRAQVLPERQPRAGQAAVFKQHCNVALTMISAEYLQRLQIAEIAREVGRMLRFIRGFAPPERGLDDHRCLPPAPVEPRLARDSPPFFHGLLA